MIKNYFSITKRSSGNRAFTIIETLVAISILLLALTGPLVIVSQSLKASYYARDQITAFYLAQEAIEYIRNLRDASAISTASPLTADNWLMGIYGNSCDNNGDTKGLCVNPYGSQITHTSNLTRNGSGYTFGKCGTGAICSPLVFDPTFGGSSVPYGESGGGLADSIFSRTISLNGVPTDPNGGREVLVKVEVKWQQGTNQNSFVLEDHLTNWIIGK